MNPTKKTSHKMIYDALTLHASDIHFIPRSAEIVVYYRINGVRVQHRTISFEQYEPLLSFYKFTSGMDIGEVRKPQNGVISFEDSGLTYALRLSTLPVHTTESLAIRILPQHQIPQLKQLFLFPSQLQKIKRWTSQRSGIILFTGPTGSGKTTTLYALLQTLLQEQSFQTITLEDPIEKEISNILQVQVNEKAGMTYDTGLKAALRHDPDILMVGEIRDRQTAQFAFHAAHTGHLVLTTLHSKNAFGTIYRLKEMGISQSDLEQTLISVASQELLPISNQTSNKSLCKRAAILELLEGDLLKQAINGQPPYSNPYFVSFHQLRRKAYALGFISQEIFKSIYQ